MNSRVSRRTFLGLSLGAAAGVVAACTPTQAPPTTSGQPAATAAEPAAPTAAPVTQPVEIIYHADGGDDSYYGLCAALFNKRQDKIHVKLESTPGSDYLSKLLTLAAGGTLGDTYYTPIFGVVFPFAAAGLQLALNDLISRDGIDMAQFFQGPIQVLTWDGQIQALPWDAHCGFTTLYVNTDEFEKAGADLPAWEWTYDRQFLDAIIRVHESMNKDASQKRFGFEFPYMAQAALTFIRSWGGDWIDPETRTQSMINSEKTVAALSFMRDLVLKDKVAPKREEVVDNMFDNALVGSFMQGNWLIGTYATTVADKFKWQALAMPAGPEGGRGTFIGADCNPINKNSKNVDATWEFIKFGIFDDEAVALLIPNGMSPSARKKYYSEPPVSTDPNWEATRKWMEVATGWTVPKNARVAEFKRIFESGMYAMLEEGTDFATEISNLHTALQNLLNMPPA